VLDLNSD